MKALPEHYYVLLEELQAIDFVIVDLNLYLDTHPNDEQAIQQYNQCVKESKRIKKEFEKQFGPLTSFGYSYSRHPWEWIEAPWPWQV